MTLLHSHLPFSCKEGTIYSKALRYNMVITEDQIGRKNYPLHLIITNKKKALTHNRNNLLSQRTPHRVTNILPIITPFSDIGKLFTATIRKSWYAIASETTFSTIQPSKPLSAYTKFGSTHNHHVHSAQACDSSRQDFKHSYPYTPIYNTDIPTVIYPQLYTFPPPLYQTHATNLGSMDNIMGHQDML